jgi:hypothetical protein
VLLRGRRRALSDEAPQRPAGQRRHLAALAIRRRRIGSAGVAEADAERLHHAADTSFRLALSHRRRAAGCDLPGLTAVELTETAISRRITRYRRPARSTVRAAGAAAVAPGRSADGRAGRVSLCVAARNRQREREYDVRNDHATNACRTPRHHRREYRESKLTRKSLPTIDRVATSTLMNDARLLTPRIRPKTKSKKSYRDAVTFCFARGT